MWWRITAALAVTWLFGLTHATLEMWMEPENKNVYYVEEGGPKSIQCRVRVDKGVTVNLTWSGPSIDASKPQRVSNIPQEKYDLVGNWLNITHFSNTTAGEYKCRALTSAPPPNNLPRTIKLVRGCDVGHFNPPSCKESCSAYCNAGPNGTKGRNCDHINGRCLYGCQEGHAGLKCTECDNDRFNHPSCNKNCSTYCNPGPYEAKGRNCHHMNGTCLSGCQEGYKMPFCTEKSDELGDTDVEGLKGGLIFVCLLLVVIIVVLLVRWFMKRRKATPAGLRQRKNKEKKELIEKENTISNLQGQINHLETEKRKLEQDKVDLKEKADGEISTLKAEIDKQKEEKKNRRESYFNLALQHEKVKQQLEDLIKQLEDLIKQREEMKIKIENLEKNEKILLQEKEKLKEDKGFLDGRLKEKESAEKLRQEKEDVKGDKRFLEGRLQEKESAENLQAELAKMRNEMLEKKKELLKVTSEKNALQEDFAKMNAQVDNILRDFLKIQEELQKLAQMQEAEINTLKDEIKRRKEEKESADKSIEKLQELNQKQEAEVKSLSGEIDQMSQEKTTADKEIERFKEQLENKEKQHQAEKRNLKTQIDRLTTENENLQAQIQEQDAQVKRLKEDINQMKEEKNEADGRP